MRPWEVHRYLPEEWREMVQELNTRAKAQKKAEQEARQRSR